MDMHRTLWDSQQKMWTTIQPSCWDDNNLGDIRIVIPPEHLNIPQSITVSLEVQYFYKIFKIAQQIGAQGVETILEFVRMLEDGIIDHIEHQHGEPIPFAALPRQAAHSICLQISSFDIPDVKQKRRGYDPELERVSQFLYVLLTRFRIGHERAAQIARALLGKEMSTDAWRKYINRWAERNGLEKPDLRRKEEHVSDTSLGEVSDTGHE